MPHLPTIFLSSTFYDLQQVRADLVTFIQEGLGYRAMASELNSFPIDPDTETVENCKRRVEQDADALVLVIGGRYGSVVPASGKSVTNLEYLAARAKGIPIFAFVKSDVLAQLETWRANPGADFRSVVDDPRVFQFISDVRGPHSVWTQAFTLANEIIDALRQQFAYRMMEGLSLLRQLQGSPSEYTGFSGRALRIVLERPLGWKALLLAQLIDDEVTSSDDLRLAYDSRVSFGSGDRVSEDDMPVWHPAVLRQAQRLCEGLQNIINQALDEAGEAEDGARIATCARIIGGGYREAIQWAVNLRKAFVPDDWVPIVSEMSLITRDIIHDLEAIPGRIRRLVQLTAEGIAPDEHRSADLHLTLRISNVEGVEREMNKLLRRRGVRTPFSFSS